MAMTKESSFDNLWTNLVSIGLKFLIAPALIIAITALLWREIFAPLRIFFPFITLLLVVVFSLSLGVVIRLEFRKKGVVFVCVLFAVMAVIILVVHFVCQCLSGFSIFLAATIPFYVYAGGIFGQILKNL